MTFLCRGHNDSRFIVECDHVHTYVVTGGAGFIGSHIVKSLLSGGNAVLVIDDLSTGLSSNLPRDTPLFTFDVSNGHDLQNLTKQLPAIDAVFHCAAQASVSVSTEDPERDYAVNATGTAHLLEMCEALSCPLVFTSTAGVYGDDAPRPTPENSTIAPLSPYAFSKATAESLIHNHSTRTGLPHAICRLANVYGPRQRGDGEAGVVAVIANKLSSGQPITLYGRGAPTRDFVHVQDVASALLTALGTRGVFNVATGTETSVRDVFDLACDALGVNVSPVLAELRAGEILHSSLSTTHTGDILGWFSRISVADGIPSTIRALAGET